MSKHIIPTSQVTPQQEKPAKRSRSHMTRQIRLGDCHLQIKHQSPSLLPAQLLAETPAAVEQPAAVELLVAVELPVVEPLLAETPAVEQPLVVTTVTAAQ